MNHPLNTILYGPPGTGKTYATFRRCVEICDGSADDVDAVAIRSRYDQLVDQERVEFVTFHQSYGYEEFVEGLRPEAEESGGLRLVSRDGVLKKIAARAENAPLEKVGSRRFFKVSMEDQGLFEECVRDGWAGHYWPKNEDWSDSRYDFSDAVKNRIKEGQLGPLDNFAPRETVTFRSKMRRGDLIVVPVSTGSAKPWSAGDSSRYRAVGEVIGDYEFHEGKRFPHRRAVRWHWVSADNPEPVSAFQEKEFGNMVLHRLYPDRPNALLKHLKQHPALRLPYVLVIDEINRANIAKVMGELITLLEDDKRAGAENEIVVTLPHSSDRFTLPANLHVLGTMNTADRSIALLDTALRRRFTFEEIAPDPTLLTEAGEKAGIDLPAVLRTMNDRLEWLVGRDHRIGHAWFLGARSRQDVDGVMRRKVIPLIAEYFYDDWEKVRAVLGGTDAFVTGKELEAPPGLDGAGETRFRWTVRPSFAEDAYEELLVGEKT